MLGYSLRRTWKTTELTIKITSPTPADGVSPGRTPVKAGSTTPIPQGLQPNRSPATPPDNPEFTEAAQRLVSIVFDAMRKYGLKGSRAVHAVRGLFSTVHGFIMLERAGTFDLPISADASFRWLVRRYTAP